MTDWKRLIDQDHLKFEVDRDGELRIGQRSYEVRSGLAYVPQSNILLGDNHKIVFTNKDGQAFKCGVIKRTGSRLMEICNEVEPCLIACCAALDAQEVQIRELKEEIRKLKNEYGVSFE